jgi:hypothetical protein
MTPVGLRPATLAGSEFCYQLHKAAICEYVTAIWGWDEQVQRRFHDRALLVRACAQTASTIALAIGRRATRVAEVQGFCTFATRVAELIL